MRPAARNRSVSALAATEDAPLDGRRCRISMQRKKVWTSRLAAKSDLSVEEAQGPSLLDAVADREHARPVPTEVRCRDSDNLSCM